MPVKKLSVALDAEVAAAAAGAAKRRKMSLSAWLNEAAEKALKVDEGLAAVRVWERRHGPISDEAKAWADEAMKRILGPEGAE